VTEPTPPSLLAGPTPDPATLFSVDGQVAIVTGASSGLGARFAHVLHAGGARVIAFARRAERLEQLAEALPGLVTVAGDVAAPRDRERLVDLAHTSFGRVDVLVNNAGIGSPEPAETERVERFAEVMDVNVTAVFALAQMVGRHMIERRSGSIINLASILGLVASAPIKQASYAASKGAVVNLTRELAVQWARKGVRVNAIAPGWFPSEMTTEMFTDSSAAAFLERNDPMARAGRPEELDGALLFLASAASSYVTGHVLTVDGGWTAR
jgi:NAD(P)-dependent dehydrogenase (short-subunit alcohol dehydrogenase family)